MSLLYNKAQVKLNIQEAETFILSTIPYVVTAH